jgi:hypothetical protein
MVFRGLTLEELNASLAQGNGNEVRGCYSARLTPDPPISFGKSFIFGNPSFIRSLVSS